MPIFIMKKLRLKNNFSNHYKGKAANIPSNQFHLTSEYTLF